MRRNAAPWTAVCQSCRANIRVERGNPGMRRLVGSAVWGAAALATTVACSFSVGSGVTVDKKDLAKEISAQLEKQVGRAPDSVDCPDDLKGEVGATTRCTLKD